MLLKSLLIKDFRQFKGEQRVSFSIDKVKNVTIFMGSNGSGKTTLAQAFTWCLYGNTDFDDKSILCKATAAEMMPEAEESVKVELELIHNEIGYSIRREQRYSKDRNGILKQPSQTTFYMSFKNTDGQREFINALQTENRMNEILPRELSQYFFFDGERIGNMSKEIRKGKSKEFSRAVRSLLGLSAFIAAIDHLNGRPPKNSVVRSYDENYDAKSNQKLDQFNKRIGSLEEEISEIDTRLEEIEDERNLAKEKIEELQKLIKSNSESEFLIIEKETLKTNITSTQKKVNGNQMNLLKKFNQQSLDFFSRRLIRDVLLMLSEADKLNRGIPDIHARTINFLVERGYCVCGNKIEEGNNAFKNLQDVLEFIPPHSIGNSINNFVSEAEIFISNSDLLFNEIENQYSQIRSDEISIFDGSEKITQIDEKLRGMKNVGTLQEQLMRFEHADSGLEDETRDLLLKKGGLETQLERENTGRKELTLKDANNRRIEIYKSYALYMHKILSSMYKEEEQKTREQLQDTVNNLFKTIYNGIIFIYR